MQTACLQIDDTAMHAEKKEIGSEFWTGCTPLDGTGIAPLLPAGMDVHYTLCGRTALDLVLRDSLQTRPVRKAYLPSYCCHTMIEPFIAKGIEVLFYNVFFTDTGVGCSFDRDNECDMVLLMDYFGFRDKQTALLAADQASRGKVVLYDATHAMFCKNMDYSACDYVFGSFRKWFGVNAGFCVKQGNWKNFPSLTKNSTYTNQRNHAFLEKQSFMAGASIRKDNFLQAFSQAENSLEADYVGYGPDDESRNTLKTVNVAYIRRKRLKNATFVIQEINAMNSRIVCSPYRQVSEEDCPLFVPLKIAAEARASLRCLLIERQIYLPIHWPLSSLHKTDKVSQTIYDTELSFVCDQRYSLEDMERAIEIIRSFDYG